MIPTSFLKLDPITLDKKGIYAIYCRISEKAYIGSTAKSFKDRFNDHKTKLRKTQHCSRHLQRAWDLYGKEGFIFLAIENFEGSPEQLVERENYYIDQCWAEDKDCLYNSTRAAVGGAPGIKRSEEFKKKVSEFMKTRPNAMLGKKHSPETLQKMSEVKLGKTKGEDFKKKMSEIVKGRKWSEESKQAFRKPKSEEAKRKMSEAKKGKKLSEETKKRKRETLKAYLEN